MHLPVLKVVVRMTLRLGTTAIIPFLAAGRVDWRNGWLLMALLTVNLVVVLPIVYKLNPEVIQLRMQPIRPTRGFDQVFVAAALALSFPMWLSIGLGIWLVIEAFGIDIAFTGSILLIALLVVGVSVPTPGGVGGFEAAVQIGLTSFYNVPNDRAVGAALVLHLVSLLPVVVLGFMFLIQEGLGFGGMRNLAHAAAEGDAR